MDEDVSFLQKIPFNLVYHDSWFGPAEREQTVHRRNAEVLVPQWMGLENLRLVGCRSDAEYRTLLHLLPPKSHSRWIGKIGVLSNLQLFHRMWTYVEQVDMSTEKIVFSFNRSSSTPGPFDACVEIDEAATGITYRWQQDGFQCKQPLQLFLSNLSAPFDYTARLFLDNQLAYADRFQSDDLPF